MTCIYCGGPLMRGPYPHWKVCADQCRRASTFEGGLDPAKWIIMPRPTKEEIERGKPAPRPA